MKHATGPVTLSQRDVGVEFRRTIRDQDGRAVRLDQASSVLFVFEGPDRGVTEATASLPNGGSDGVASYVSVSGDLDHAGTYRWWVEVRYTSGARYTSEPATFSVRDRPEVS